MKIYFIFIPLYTFTNICNYFKSLGLTLQGFVIYMSFYLIALIVASYSDIFMANRVLMLILILYVAIMVLITISVPGFFQQAFLYFMILRIGVIFLIFTPIGIAYFGSIDYVSFMHYVASALLYDNEDYHSTGGNITIQRAQPPSVFVPYNITPGVIKGTKALTDIYNYASEHNVDLFNFLTKNCKHLLSVPQDKSDTPISLSIISEPKVSITLKDSFQYTPIRNYSISSGVYSFICDDKFVNIGSATEFKTRLGNYYQDYSKFLSGKSMSQKTFFTHVKNAGGFPSLKYSILHTTPNFKHLYLSQPGVQQDGISREILTNFSKHQPRILEQALQHYFRGTQIVMLI